MPLDRHNPAVVDLITEIETLTESKRDALERPQKSHDETQYVRGQIKSLRWVLDKIKGDPETDELPS